MQTSTKLIIGILLVLGVVLVIVKYSINNAPGQYDQFAQCLTESGAIMYGAYWCPHCQNQKKSFGNSFKYVKYIECDARGNDGNPAACEAANVNTYPTWIFANGERREGEVPLTELAIRSGCGLRQG